MSVYEDLHDENTMKNLKTFLIVSSILVFNTYVWTVIFDNYKEFHKDSVRTIEPLGAACGISITAVS